MLPTTSIMSPNTLSLMKIIGLAALTAAQTIPDGYFVLDPTDCVATPVTMSSCTSFVYKLENCFSTLEAQAVADCWCPQTVLDYIAGCHQEWWDCLQSSTVDDLFTGTNGLYYTWSTMCTQVDGLAYSPTTRLVTTPGNYDQAFCNDAALDCASLTTSMESCSTEYVNSPTDLTSCLCNADMLFLGSRCDTDVNQSCLKTTLESAFLYSNQFCSRVSVSGLVSRTSLLPTESGPVSEPTSTYIPPTPSATGSAGAATTAVAGNDGTSWLKVDKGISQLALVAAVLIFAN